MPLDSRHIAFAIVLWQALSLADHAYADDEFSETKSTTTVRLLVTGSYFNFSREGKALSAIGPEGGIEKALAPKLVIGAGIGQAYGTGAKPESLFTSFGANVWYAVTGRFTQDHHKWTLDGRPLANYSSRDASGLRFGLSMQQYIFNATASSTPFSGFTTKLQYEFVVPDLGNLALGAEAGSISNKTDQAALFRIYLTYILPLTFQ